MIDVMLMFWIGQLTVFGTPKEANCVIVWILFLIPEINVSSLRSSQGSTDQFLGFAHLVKLDHRLIGVGMSQLDTKGVTNPAFHFRTQKFRITSRILRQPEERISDLTLVVLTNFIWLCNSVNGRWRDLNVFIHMTQIQGNFLFVFLWMIFFVEV